MNARARLRCVVAAGLVLAALSPRARAQRVTSSLDIGRAAMRYADTLDATAAVYTPAISIQWPRFSLGGTASASQLGPGAWTSQGTLNASAWIPLGGRFSAEASGAGGGSAHQDGTRTAQLLGTARVYAIGASGGAWAGAGLGRMGDGVTARSVRVGEVGAWFGGSTSTWTVMASPNVVDDTIRYTDLQAMLQAHNERLELLASVGSRSGSHLPTLGGRTSTWGSVNGVAWLTPSFGIVVGAGTYPVDFTQGFPGGRFATIGARLRWRSREAVSADAIGGASAGVAPTPVAADRGRVTDFTFVRGAERHVTLRVRAPAADRVELAGDFTEWQTVTLVRADDGWWVLDTEIAAGTHQVGVRVNGEQWVAPPGLITVTDEFGGVVGLLLIS